MSTNYDFELRITEKEYQLMNQQGMLKKVQLEEMRLERKLKDYEKTKKDLEKAIEETQNDIELLQSGEIPKEGGEK